MGNCHKCPQGAVCDGVSPPVAMQGFLSNGKDFLGFDPCISPKACLAGSTFTAPDGCEERVTSDGNTISTCCAVGFEGKFCSQCSTRYMKTLNGECEACPYFNWRLLVASIVMIIIGLICFYGFTRLKLDPKLFIMTVNFLQTIDSLQSINLRWSNSVIQFFAWATASNLNVNMVISECSITDLSFPVKWFITQHMPLVFVLGAGAFYGIIATFNLTVKSPPVQLMSPTSTRHRLNAPKEQYANTAETRLDLFIRLVVMILDIFYLTIAKNTVSVFSCIPFHGDLVLEADTAIICDATKSSTYHSLVTAAYVWIGIYIVGVPAAFSFIIFYHKEAIQTDQQHRMDNGCYLESDDTKSSRRRSFFSEVDELEKIRRRYLMLYGDYKPEYYYWKLYLTFRKLILIIGVVYFSKDDALSQANIICLVLLLALLVQHHASPYIAVDDGQDPLNLMEYFSTMTTIALLLLGGLMTTTANAMDMADDPVKVESLQFKMKVVDVITLILLISLSFGYVYIIFKYGRPPSEKREGDRKAEREGLPFESNLNPMFGLEMEKKDEKVSRLSILALPSKIKELGLSVISPMRGTGGNKASPTVTGVGGDPGDRNKGGSGTPAGDKEGIGRTKSTSAESLKQEALRKRMKSRGSSMGV